MPTFTSFGDTLHYDDRGSGPLVAVVGGGPARHPDYLGDVGGLGAGFRLVVHHLRGSGRSQFPSDPQRASGWAQGADLEQLRSALGVERLTVLAHSAGTRVALAFAARYPASVERLVLVTPPAADLVDATADIPAIRERRAAEPGYAEALAALQAGPPAGADDDGLNDWQQQIARVTYARWESAQQDHARVGRWSVPPLRAFGSVAPPSTFLTDLRSVRAPVAVIAAAEDGVTGTAAPVVLADVFADGQATVIGGAGHYVWVDQPDEFRAAAESALLR